MIFRFKADCKFEAENLDAAFLQLSNHFQSLMGEDVPGDQQLQMIEGSMDLRRENAVVDEFDG